LPRLTPQQNVERRSFLCVTFFHRDQNFTFTGSVRKGKKRRLRCERLMKMVCLEDGRLKQSRKNWLGFSVLRKIYVCRN
jgi:hypothetical protein